MLYLPCILPNATWTNLHHHHTQIATLTHSTPSKLSTTPPIVHVASTSTNKPSSWKNTYLGLSIYSPRNTKVLNKRQIPHQPFQLHQLQAHHQSLHQTTPNLPKHSFINPSHHHHPYKNLNMIILSNFILSFEMVQVLKTSRMASWHVVVKHAIKAYSYMLLNQ